MGKGLEHKWCKVSQLKKTLHLVLNGFHCFVCFFSFWFGFSPFKNHNNLGNQSQKLPTTFSPLGVLPGATPTTWRKLCLNFGGMGCRTLKVKQMNVKHVKLRLTIGNAVKRDSGQSSAWLGYAQRALCCCNTS